MRVKCLNGNVTWILIHLEIQKQPNNNYPERMFIYRYRLFDKYKQSVLSVAILIDNNPKWRPNLYKQELFDTRLEMEYLVIKLLDYQHQELDKTNPFSIVSRSHLDTLDTQKDNQERFRRKVAVTRILYELEITINVLPKQTLKHYCYGLSEFLLQKRLKMYLMLNSCEQCNFFTIIPR